MPASLLPWIKPQFCDAEGVPVAGGQLYSFVAGTDTPQTTYTDSDLLIPNSNPIILNAGGWSATSIYLLPTGYKFRLDTADDVPLWTVDYILGEGSADVSGAWTDIAFDAANFTTPGGIWTVDVSVNRWRTIGDNLIVWVFQANSSIGGAPTTGGLFISNLPFTPTAPVRANTRVVVMAVPSGNKAQTMHLTNEAATFGYPANTMIVAKEESPWYTATTALGFVAVLEITPA